MTEREGCTRAQVASDVAVSIDVLRSFERLGLIAPTVYSPASWPTSEVALYDLEDVAVARFVTRARRLGVSRRDLLVPAQRLREHYLPPGWHGWALVSERGVHALPTSALAETVGMLAADPRRPASLLVPVEVPATYEEVGR